MKPKKLARYLERVSKSGFPCVLCPKRGGALKALGPRTRPLHSRDSLDNPTSGPKSQQTDVSHEFISTDRSDIEKGSQTLEQDEIYMAHVACLYWLLAAPNENETISACVQRTLRELEQRGDLCWMQQVREHAPEKCIVCKQRGVGICLRCAAPACDVTYHVTCAQQVPLWMDLGTRQSLCPKHTRLRSLNTNEVSTSALSQTDVQLETPPKRRRGRPSRAETQQRHLGSEAGPKAIHQLEQSLEDAAHVPAVGQDAKAPIEAGEFYRNLRQGRRAMERLRTLADLVWRREMVKLGHAEICFKYLKRSVAAHMRRGEQTGFNASPRSQLKSTKASRIPDRGVASPQASPKRRRISGAAYERHILANNRSLEEEEEEAHARPRTSQTSTDPEIKREHRTQSTGVPAIAMPAPVQVGAPSQSMQTSLRLSGFVGSALRVAGAAFRFSRGNGRQGT
ncbi:hypothetical protein CCYA_CCYA06G1781 [Cyanidiococcus yangmingshanensis]|nr:hypothetical protein CCYA_CCYA06G1781 [Cyanidiococcus yangmingshanensis]